MFLERVRVGVKLMYLFISRYIFRSIDSYIRIYINAILSIIHRRANRKGSRPFEYRKPQRGNTNPNPFELASVS